MSTRPSDYYAARLAELRAQQAEARAEWVRQTEARHQERLAALRERAAAEIRMHERMRARVQEAGVQSVEIENMLNELAELIPGWEERKRAAAERVRVFLSFVYIGSLGCGLAAEDKSTVEWG